MEELEKLESEKIELGLEVLKKIVVLEFGNLFYHYLPKGEEIGKTTEALLEYAKKFQDQYIKENNDGKEHVPIESCHTNQGNKIDRMEQQIDHELKDLALVSNYRQEIHCEGLGEDSFVNEEKILKGPGNTIKSMVKNAETYKNRVLFEMMQTERNNIKFTENIVSLCDQMEMMSSDCPTLLHKVLHDKPEHLSQLVGSKAAGHNKLNQLSEDSGICSERKCSETSLANMEATPTGISTDVLRSKNTNITLLDSLKSVLDFIKNQSNLKTVFDNWKKSEVELACNVVCEYMQYGDIECEEIVQNFIIDLLQDIWSDTELNHHAKWKRQLDIVKELLVSPSVCLEVFYFTKDILENIITDLSKRSCTPLIALKITMFLHLFPIMVGTLNVLKKIDSSKKSQEVITVTKLWYDKFSPEVRDNYDQNLIQGIKTDIAPKLVEFLTILLHKEPLISLVAKEALGWLEKFDVEIHDSQDSPLHVSSQGRV